MAQADPLGFGLCWKVSVTGLMILGYSVVSFAEATGHILFGRRDKIVEAFGHYGRKLVDQIGEVFR